MSAWRTEEGKSEGPGGPVAARSRIIEDEPGRVLHLALPAQPGPAWRRFARSLRYLFYPVFWVLLRWRARDDELVGGHARSVHLDRERQTLTLGLAPRGLAPPLEWTLDLTRVHVTRVQAKRDKHGLSIHLALRDTERSLVSFDVRVVDLEQRSEALDLAFRLAHVAELSGYRVRHLQDSDALDVELVPEADGRSSGPFRTGGTGGGALPVPELARASDYEAGPTPAFIEPDDDSPAFDPDSIAGVTRWDPGTSIVFHRPGQRTHPREMVSALGRGLALLGVVVWFVGSAVLALAVFASILVDLVGFDLHGFDLVISGTGAVCVIVALVFAVPILDGTGLRWWRVEPREVTFDWDLHIVTVTVATDGSRRQWGMGEIQGVRARTVSRRPLSMVELLLPGDDIELVRLPSDTARVIAISLARALDVPWRAEGASQLSDS